MAQFSRIEVATTMKEVGMIPLFFNNDLELSKKVLKACYDGVQNCWSLQQEEILHMRSLEI